MKRKIAIAAAALAVALSPMRAMAAEEAPAAASWLRLLFFAINFTLFVGVLVYYAAPMVRKFFGERASGIRAMISRATTAFQEAQDFANQAAAGIAGLEAELARLKAEIEAETAHQVRTVGEMAKSGAERIRRDAEMTAAAIAVEAQRRVRNRLAAAAARTARGFIADNFAEADQARLLEGFMEKLSQEARP